MSESPPIDTPPAGGPAADTALAFDRLTKHFGKVRALDGLNLRVRRGEVYGFLGRNGAGKSTAIRIAMGITRPSAGAVSVFGEPLTARAVRVRRRIGYVAQEQNFYGWMTAASIGRFVGGFYPTWNAAEYARLLAQLDLPAGRKIRTFSGGMKARLALALALAHEPELLILDEPTAGLDAIGRREFIEMVREQAERSSRTTFFSSHLIDEVEAAADRVGIIEDGRAIYEGDLVSLSSRVRRLAGPIEDEPPEFLRREHLQVLQDRAYRGRREIVVRTRIEGGFDGLPLPAMWVVEIMSLEDIFVSLVSRPLEASSDAPPARAVP